MKVLIMSKSTFSTRQHNNIVSITFANNSYVLNDGTNTYTYAKTSYIIAILEV